MEFEEEDRAPQVISMRNLVLAFGLHVVAFLLLWLFSVLHFKPKETIVPIELMFEAPPEEVAPEEPKPEPPKPVVKPPEPPPVVEEKVDAVVRIKDEKKPEKKKPEPPKEKPKPPEPEKPKEPPKPEKPKKSKEELKKEREERLRKMRDGAKVVKNPKPTPVAGTGTKLDPNWRKYLAEGAKAGDRTQIATSEMQRCVSLIKMALDARWNQLSPDVGRPGMVVLEISIRPDGRLVNCRIVRSCGDSLSDKAALTVASTTGRVAGLSPEFIRQNPTLKINYTVEGR